MQSFLGVSNITWLSLPCVAFSLVGSVFLVSKLQGSRRILEARKVEGVSTKISEQILSLFSLYLAIAVQMLGYTSMNPLLPLIQDYFQIEVETLGFISAALPLGMIFGTLFWSSLSDIFGRKFVLVTLMAGLSLMQLLQLLVMIFCRERVFLYFSLRVLGGFFSALSPVAKAYIGDISNDRREATRLISWRETSATLSYIIGPSIGGILSCQSVLYAIGFNLILSVVSTLLLILYLRDLEIRKNPKPDLEEDLESQTPGMIIKFTYLMLIQFVYSYGQHTFDTFFGLFLQKNYSLESYEIGGLATIIACTVFVVLSTRVFLLFHRLVGFHLTGLWGLLLVSLGLFGLGLCQNPFFVGIAFLFYSLGLPLYTTTMSVVMGMIGDAHSRGKILGLEATLVNVIRSVTPILGAYLYNLAVSATFNVAAGMVLIAATLFRNLNL